MVDRMAPQPVTSATYLLDPENNQGATVYANRAAGQAFTLPASVGDGTTYTIVVGTAITSNSTTIKVANSTDVMTGQAQIASAADNSVSVWETAASSDTITMNGTTTGGLKGDKIVLQDVAAGFWSVLYVGAGSGTLASPFSATV